MSKGKNKPTAFSAGIGYTIGNFLIKGISFLSIPIFSRLLTTEQFGIYNIFISYDAIIHMIISLAVHSSIRSANIEFKGKIKEYVSSISLIYILNLGVLGLLSTVLIGTLTNLINFNQMMVYMLLLYSFSTGIITLYNQEISLNYSYKKYIIVALANSLGNVLVSLFLIFTVFDANRLYGRVIGATLTYTILMILVLCYFYHYAKPRFNKDYWRFALKYSLPIVPHGISQVLLSQFDRIMISSLVNNSAAGIYSLAGNIRLILTIINDSISTAWTTWFYEQMEKRNITNIQDKAKQLSGLFAILSIGLMAISKELIYVLGGAEYDSGKYVAIPMILDGFILFLYNVVVSGEYYTKKTKYIMGGTVVAATINVVTNIIFIGKYGFVAAAYTTLFSYCCYLILHICISRRLLGFYIVSLNVVIKYCALISLSACVFLYFIDNLVLRWGFCIVVITPIAIKLINDSGILNKFSKRG